MHLRFILDLRHYKILHKNHISAKVVFTLMLYLSVYLKKCKQIYICTCNSTIIDSRVSSYFGWFSDISDRPFLSTNKRCFNRFHNSDGIMSTLIVVYQWTIHVDCRFVPSTTYIWILVVWMQPISGIQRKLLYLISSNCVLVQFAIHIYVLISHSGLIKKIEKNEGARSRWDFQRLKKLPNLPKL